MTKPLIALAALTTSAVLALGAPAYASHGGDDGPQHDAGDDHGHHLGHHGHHHGGHDHGHHHGNGGDDGRMVRTGSCSDGSRWTLKVKHDDNRLEVEAEVDSTQSGQTWAWQLRDNGTVEAQGSATTGGRSGSFSVERRIADLAGTDTVVFQASHGAASCAGAVAF